MAVKKEKGASTQAKSSPLKTSSKTKFPTVPDDHGPDSEWGKEMISTYGKDHPWVQVNVFREMGNWKPSDKTEEPKKKKINGAKKGKAFEREWANAIGHIFPEAKRHLEYQADESSHGADLVGTDVFKFQLKNWQGYAPVGTISEVKKLKNGEVPVLITKGNKLPTMAVLPATAFIHLLEVYYGLEPQKKAHPVATQIADHAREIQKALASPEDNSPIVVTGLDPAVLSDTLTVSDLV